MWSPWGWDPANREAAFFRRAHWVSPIARLKPGVTPERADAALQVVVERLQGEYPETNRVMGAGLMPLRDFLVKDVRRPLGILLGAVALLLLLACTNVANLMLVRASDRTREVALRFAMGARGGRIVRQILTEGLLLALVGGVLGLALGWVGVRAIAAQQPIGIAGATKLALDTRVVLFTVGVAVASGLLFGLAPALRAAAGDLQQALREGGRGGSAGRGTMRTAGVLVAVEVALAVLLVAGAGLMVRTFWLLRDVDPGFRTEGVVAVQFGIPSARYPNRDQVAGLPGRLRAAHGGTPRHHARGDGGPAPPERAELVQPVPGGGMAPRSCGLRDPPSPRRRRVLRGAGHPAPPGTDVRPERRPRRAAGGADQRDVRARALSGRGPHRPEDRLRPYGRRQPGPEQLVRDRGHRRRPAADQPRGASARRGLREPESGLGSGRLVRDPHHRRRGRDRGRGDGTCSTRWIPSSPSARCDPSETCGVRPWRSRSSF